MRGRSLLLITGLAIAGTVAAGTPAAAQPLDKGRFHDVFTDSFDCDGTPARTDGDVWINFTFNLRGSSPFPYYRENVHGMTVATNLNTGGTITILVIATGGSRYYDTDGKLVLNDPGQTRFSFDVDYNGTPSDPADDVEIPDSFQLVRDSTGRNDTAGRDFCADLVEFTS